MATATRLVTLKFILKDSTGNPLANQAIAFQVVLKSSGAVAWTGSATTDPTGTATVTTAPLAAGGPDEYVATGSFAGVQNQYDPCNASSDFFLTSGTVGSLTAAPQ